MSSDSWVAGPSQLSGYVETLLLCGIEPPPDMNASERTRSQGWQVPELQANGHMLSQVHEPPAISHGYDTYNSFSTQMILDNCPLRDLPHTLGRTDPLHPVMAMFQEPDIDAPLMSPKDGAALLPSGRNADEQKRRPPGASSRTAPTGLRMYENSLAYALVERPRASKRERSVSPWSASQDCSDDGTLRANGADGHRAESPLSLPRTDKPRHRRRPRAKVYPCPSCDKRFDRPSALATHQHAHTGEQPYPCPVPGCDRRFSVQSNARRHALTHEKPKSRPVTIEFEAPVVANPSGLEGMPPLDVKWAEES